jgi:hypothetical protein
MKAALASWAATAFLQEVRADLDDLDPAVREDLLSDLVSVLAETDDGLPDATPADFAAELRASAGLPLRPERHSEPAVSDGDGRRFWLSTALWWPFVGVAIGYARCVPGWGDGVIGVLTPRFHGHQSLAWLLMIAFAGLGAVAGAVVRKRPGLLPLMVVVSVAVFALAVAQIVQTLQFVIT